MGPHSVDHGWAWVVCASVFTSHTLTTGFSFTIGVYYVEFLDVFNLSNGTTAWISAIHLGTLMGIGPVASWMNHRWGNRVTMFLGGIVAAAGLFFTSFATDICMIFVTFGFLAGLGSGFAYSAAVVSISLYFRRLMPTALGLSFTGVAVGNMSFPWISRILIAQFGWRGALMITSGLLLNQCVCAMLILRTPPAKHETEPEEKRKSGHNFTEKELITTISESITNLNTKLKADRKQVDRMTHLTCQLFLDIHYVLLFINVFMFLFGTGILFTHIMAFAESEGIPPSIGSSMISALGFSALIGRIVLSMLSQHPRTNTLVLYIVANFLCGLFMTLLAVWTSAVGMLVCSAICGFFSASLGPTMAECFCIITGPRLFNFGHGYGIFVCGIGWLLGAPAAGILYDMTQHYPNSFYLGGAVTMAGAVVMVPAAVSMHRRPNHHSDEISVKI